MKKIAILLMMLLAGCFSPGGLRDFDTPIDFKSTRSPRELAQCLALNAEKADFANFVPAQWREGRKPGAYEVLLGSLTIGMVLVADVEPTREGSSALIWRTPYLAHRINKDRIIEGCY